MKKLISRILIAAFACVGCVNQALAEEYRTGAGLLLVRSDFGELPGWTADRLSKAPGTLEPICRRLLARPPAEEVGSQGMAGLAGDWHRPCGQLLGAVNSESRLRRILQSEFVPLEVWDTGSTVEVRGFGELVVTGSRTRSERFRYPIYKRPSDLVVVRLSDLDPSLPGTQLYAKLASGRLVPYPTRSEIAKGALEGKGLELAWLPDPVTAFELELNRGGLIQLAEGGELRVSVAASNGREFVHLGRALFQPKIPVSTGRSRLPKKDTSMASALAWLRDHPAEAARTIALNHRLSFFKEAGGPGPLAVSGYDLVPGRSLFVDAKALPIGLPYWLDLEDQNGAAIRRLAISHDAGNQVWRGSKLELFMPAEAGGEEFAAQGRLWVLLPHGALDRLPKVETTTMSTRKTQAGH